MISGSSNGGINVAPVWAAIRAAVTRRSGGSTISIDAPSALIASTFTAGDVDGITTVAGMPARNAAKASALPWLPDEWVTTAVGERAVTALTAPRILNAPIGCRLS